MTWKAVLELEPGEVRAYVVPWAARARQGTRPHSKPPFWKTWERGVGLQVGDGVVAVGPQEQAELYAAGLLPQAAV